MDALLFVKQMMIKQFRLVLVIKARWKVCHLKDLINKVINTSGSDFYLVEADLFITLYAIEDKPEFVNNFENDDYNNAYYNVAVLEE